MNVAQRATGARRMPNNLRMCGVVLDREHAGELERLTDIIISENARAAIAKWRASIDRFPFLVLGGTLHTTQGQSIAGLAADWDSAKKMIAYTFLRFEEVSEQRRLPFSIAWFLLLPDELITDAHALAAMLQPVAGHA